MVNGNSLVLQMGAESTYGTLATPDRQIRVSSESFKPVYNKVEEGLFTGGKGASRKEIMSERVEGDISTLARPDDLGLFLKAALGEEETVTGSATTGYVHTFKAIGTDEDDELPAISAILDRKVGVFGYAGLKINTLSFNAAPEDYLKLDINFVGKTESTGEELVSSLKPSTLKSFKFRHGEVKLASTKVADITNIKFDYNNNLQSDIQTTSTGLYFKEPEVGVRNLTTELEMLYSSDTEELRTDYYKTDSDVKIELTFTSDEEIVEDVPYALTITIPHNQCSDSTANMTGADNTKQTMNFDAWDNGTDELVTVTLKNGESGTY